jgi:cytochrome c oxidase assembly factor CtaG
VNQGPHLAEVLPPFAVAAAYGTAYALRARTLARADRRVDRARVLAFSVGIGIVVAVQLPPLDNLADRVLMVHMAQHLLIGDIASLLVVLGLSGPLLAPLLRNAATRWTRPFTHPLVALGLWALDNYVWRVPILYQAALRHDLLHALEHASYLWAGVLLWVALLGPLPKPAWFDGWGSLGYVVAVRFAGAILANAFIWSQSVFYPYYRLGDARAGLRPLSDQNVAGALMMIEQMLLTIGLLGWLFFRFARRDEERQELLDLAARRGVPLTAERAARAARAGESARLRERLLAGELEGGHTDATRDPG